MKLKKKLYEGTIKETGKRIHIDLCYCCNSLTTAAEPCISGDMVLPLFREIARIEGFTRITNFGVKGDDCGTFWAANFEK